MNDFEDAPAFPTGLLATWQGKPPKKTKNKPRPARRAWAYTVTDDGNGPGGQIVNRVAI